MPKNSGFTLIEMLIVVAISAMLAGIAIGYSGAERDQTSLSVEVTEISQFILQARSLAIATYSNGGGGGSACGYGVSINQDGTYSIFAYVPNADPSIPCPSVSDVVSAPAPGTEVKSTDQTWEVHPQSGITFSMASATALSAILFYPPDPTTLLFNKSGSLIMGGSGSINLLTPDGKSSRTITVDLAGQVSL